MTREYYLKHREEILAKQKATRALPENKEKRDKWHDEYVVRNLDRERERKRKWYFKNKERVLQIVKKFRHENKEKVALYNKAHTGKFPDRIKTRQKFARAVRMGKIIRPARCQLCTKECFPEGHHHKGYAPEFWDDIIWLCEACHGRTRIVQ